MNEAFSSVEGQDNPKKSSAAEKRIEKPVFSPEETEAIKNLSAKLKDDLEACQHALSELGSSADKMKDQKIVFFKSFIDQLELKLGLPSEKKLALVKMEKLMADHPSMLRAETDRKWINMKNGVTGEEFRIDEDPISVSEDGSVWASTLELDQKKADETAELLKEIPEGVLFKACVVDGGKMLESVPKKVGKLLLRPQVENSKQAAVEFANQVKAFLSSEHEVEEFSSTGESAESSAYGYFVNDFRKMLEEMPASQIKLKVGHDQNGFPKGRAFSTDTGNMPLAGYLQKAFPKEAK